MGIDKSDVRLVAHVQLPSTLEAYYQEAGRAGRDGLPAACVALYAPNDRRIGRMFIDRTHPPRRVLRRLLATLRREADPFGVVSVDAERHDWARGRRSPEDLRCALDALQRTHAIRILPGSTAAGDGTGAGTGGPLPIRTGLLSTVDLARADALRRAALGKLDGVQSYARGRGCRRSFLLRYFGEEPPRRCDRCDRCVPP